METQWHSGFLTWYQAHVLMAVWATCTVYLLTAAGWTILVFTWHIRLSFIGLLWKQCISKWIYILSIYCTHASCKFSHLASSAWGTTFQARWHNDCSILHSPISRRGHVKSFCRVTAPQKSLYAPKRLALSLVYFVRNKYMSSKL